MCFVKKKNNNNNLAYLFDAENLIRVFKKVYSERTWVESLLLILHCLSSYWHNMKRNLYPKCSNSLESNETTC